MTGFDWVGWHQGYDDPESSLSQRLRIVRQRIGECLESSGGAPVRILSLCAGDGRDVLPEVVARRSVSATVTLVELSESLAGDAVDAAAQLGLEHVKVIAGDAGATQLYADEVPVDLLLLCGIFGNVSDDDIRVTLGAAGAMVTEGGRLIWTRGWFEHVDLRDDVRRWTVETGFVEEAFDGEPAKYGIGVYRWDRPCRSTPLPHRLFTFIR